MLLLVHYGHEIGYNDKIIKKCDNKICNNMCKTSYVFQIPVEYWLLIGLNEY